ncbi:MAG: hypothetical protein ACLRSW_02130 [Christensenellaceae bacterium]
MVITLTDDRVINCGKVTEAARGDGHARYAACCGSWRRSFRNGAQGRQFPCGSSDRFVSQRH